jgi:DICT domain-containing protein
MDVSFAEKWSLAQRWDLSVSLDDYVELARARDEVGDAMTSTTISRIIRVWAAARRMTRQSISDAEVSSALLQLLRPLQSSETEPDM